MQLFTTLFIIIIAIITTITIIIVVIIIIITRHFISFKSKLSSFTIIAIIIIINAIIINFKSTMNVCYAFINSSKFTHIYQVKFQIKSADSSYHLKINFYKNIKNVKII